MFCEIIYFRRARALLSLGHFAAVEEACARVLENPFFASSAKNKQDIDAAKLEAKKVVQNLSEARQKTDRLSVLEMSFNLEGLIKVSMHIFRLQLLQFYLTPFL